MTTAPLKQKIQIVTIAQKQLLLLQFAKYHNGGFQNITGSVEEAESFEQAAARELQEEIGLEAELTDIGQSFSFKDRWGFEVEEKVFLCQLREIPDITLSPEHQSYKWLPLEKVTVNDFAFPTNFEAFKKALEFYHA